MRKNEKIDLGSVQVHRKVFAEIIASAIQSVEGVDLIQNNIGSRLSAFFGQTDSPGINIKVDDDHEVVLELEVLVRYGMNIPDAARQVQKEVKSAVDRTLDIRIKDIHINVQGIEREAK